MKKFTQLKALVESAEHDAMAFYEKSNKTAGTRSSNALQQIKVAASDIRKEVTEKKNAGKEKGKTVLGRPGSHAWPHCLSSTVYNGKEEPHASIQYRWLAIN
jgi:hypothetical protein